MLSEEAMQAFGATFAARIDGSEECPCVAFPEVSGNEHTRFVVDSAMESVVEVFATTGDLDLTGKAAHHALIVAMAFGMSYARLDMLPDDDSDDFSWGLSDEQLSALAGEDFLGE
jgi:hypothetical protein